MQLLHNSDIELIRRTMDAVWLRRAVIANNIANNDTPGYKSKYVEFEEQLKESLKQAKSMSMLKKETADIKPVIKQRSNSNARHDENNVDMDAENIELARAQLQYDYLVRVLNTRLNTMRYAINGGK